MKRFICLLFVAATALVSCTKCPHTNYTAWSTVQEATCTAPGSATRECTKCHHSETKTIPALGHNFVNGVCTVCGAIEE